MITEKITKRQKTVLLTAAVSYFVVGFVLIVILTGYIVGANYAGILALAYLLLGWYFLVKKNGFLDIMRIKHT